MKRKMKVNKKETNRIDVFYRFITDSLEMATAYRDMVRSEYDMTVTMDRIDQNVLLDGSKYSYNFRFGAESTGDDRKEIIDDLEDITISLVMMVTFVSDLYPDADYELKMIDPSNALGMF